MEEVEMTASERGTGRTSAAERFLEWHVTIVLAAIVGLLALVLPRISAAQAPATPNRQIGTVKEVAANKLTIATDAGVVCSVNVVNEAKVLQLPPGSMDLKSAKTIALGDIEVGDRVLVAGHADAPDAFTASRVILMKSTDIAQKNEEQQADWQKRGSGGLVKAIDPASGTVTISSRAHEIAVKTTVTTVFRRYAGDSVKFEDATLGSLTQIQPGDQLRVRGTKSDDGSSIQAEEIVSGAFRNLAGTVVSIDLSGNKVTVKDLASKKTYSIQLTANSSLRVLPPEAAARLAAREKSESGTGAAGYSGSPSSAAAAPSSAPGSAPSSAAGPAAGGYHGERGPGGAGGGSAAGDLSQMLSRLPAGSLKDLHTGDALMVVATQPQPGSVSLTAITLLSGVEPILAATPSGKQSMTLSPWEMGGSDSGGA